jgi:uncharacterized membrane protein YagU involved in acid resistance
MKFGAIMTIFSIVVAVIYGVMFSTIYPEVQIDGGIVALCAISGLVTCLMAAGIWKLLVKQ